jgi:hypothetical protein
MLLSIPIAAGGLAIVLGAIALLVFRVAQHTAMFKSRSLNSIASTRLSCPDWLGKKIVQQCRTGGSCQKIIKPRCNRVAQCDT